MRIMKADEIPLTYGGKAKFMIQNVLAAVIAANVRGINIEDMKAALRTFLPSADQTPGRLNLFKFENFQILLDYAHNPAGMRALQKFTDELDATVKVGIIAGIGDRREEDNNEMGRIAADPKGAPATAPSFLGTHKSEPQTLPDASGSTE